MTETELTRERLAQLLVYCKSLDIWIWLVQAAQSVPGDIAGAIDRKTGYRRITIDGKQHFAHRLVWLWAYGQMPQGKLDHIDGNKLNCRIENLREIDPKGNAENQRRPHRDGSSGYLGVSHHKGKWQASIRSNGKLLYLGRFDTPEEASTAYTVAKRWLHQACTI